MRQTVRIGSTALGFALAALTAWGFMGASGCVVTTDTTTDDGGTGDDTGTPDTLPGDDTGTPGGGSIRVQAADLLASSTDATLVKDFGAGSTYDEITHLRIAYAYAQITSGPSANGVEFPSSTESPIGKDSSDNPVDGVITGLAAGDYQILVKGYLRGVNGPGVADGNTDVNIRVLIAETTCSATVADGAETIATCSPLSIADASGNLYVKGIVFPSDLLPSGYCTGAGVSKLDLWRARSPVAGTAAVSIAESDCQGVIFIPESDLASTEDASTRSSSWSLSIEPKVNSTPHCPDPANSDPNNCSACTTASDCTIVRKDASGNLDLLVVDPSAHPGCAVNATNTGTSDCF